MVFGGFMLIFALVPIYIALGSRWNQPFWGIGLLALTIALVSFVSGYLYWKALSTGIIVGVVFATIGLSGTGMAFLMPLLYDPQISYKMWINIVGLAINIFVFGLIMLFIGHFIMLKKLNIKFLAST
jgi:hypothetical protein